MKAFYKFSATLLFLVVSFLLWGTMSGEASQHDHEKNCNNFKESQSHVAKSSCGSFCSSGMRDKMAWGRWSLIDKVYYRQLFSPGPNVMGVQLYADEKGNMYRRPILPDGVLSLVENIPEWFSVEGMGIPPQMSLDKNSQVSSKDGFAPASELFSSMRWGLWTRIEGKALRQFFPPGDRRLGAQFFSDIDGNCYSRPVIPDAKLHIMERPEWFSTEEMGTAPIYMLGI